MIRLSGMTRLFDTPKGALHRAAEKRKQKVINFKKINNLLLPVCRYCLKGFIDQISTESHTRFKCLPNLQIPVHALQAYALGNFKDKF